MLKAPPLSSFAKCRKLIEDQLVQVDSSGDIVSSDPYKEEREKCTEDKIYWMRKYCKTYDPRIPNKFIPFDLFPKQEQLVRWIEDREKQIQRGICEKSRDVGVSYVCAAYALHGWLFRPGFAAGFGSYQLEAVDNLGDLNSIFEKIRFMLRGFPKWMLPKGYKEGKHNCEKKFVNPETKATIIGEGGDNLGRGGRATIYFLDEAAHVARPDAVDRAMVAVTDVRIDISTPNGAGNPFAQKRFSGEYPVFTFHWKDDPRKNDEWAEAKKKEQGLAIFASEYDIDYSASLEGICIPGAWVRAAVELKLPAPLSGNGTEHPVLPDGRVLYWSKCVAGLDVAEEGSDLSVFTPRWGPIVGVPIDWAKLDTTGSAWRARDEAVKIGAEEVYYDPLPSGIKGTWKRSETPMPFKNYPVNTGASPTESRWPDNQTSKDKFFNLKAELWWRVRERFERTYEYVTNGVIHSPEDLISIPNCPQLISQLSLPLAERTDRGKIKIEGKPSLRKRGIKSPDFADSLVLTEAAWAMKKQEFWIGVW